MGETGSSDAPTTPPGIVDHTLGNSTGLLSHEQERGKGGVGHAEHSARSYSKNSLEALAVVQSHFKHYDDAEVTFAKASERYPFYSKVWYRWAQANGREDVKTPEQKTYEYYDSLGAPVLSSSLAEIFDFCVMNKQSEKAIEVFQAIKRYSDISPQYLLLAIIVTDKQGETKDRDAILKYFSELKDSKSQSINHELITNFADDLIQFISTKDISKLDLNKLDRMFKKADASVNDQQRIGLVSG
ncbi:hypothetical protein [Rubinisphaera italica]|uniref:Uncharacterized protein n=1 Tax=Rubinisphaera italica TaxID=2527969 RepID=A0A5C5XE72_9PLAN|nr:hypothetical protein [Rubinisphaera italica]TWT60701.1 hypothetical protein Pan54_14280 [Rubinisphaera italica]